MNLSSLFFTLRSAEHHLLVENSSTDSASSVGGLDVEGSGSEPQPFFTNSTDNRVRIAAALPHLPGATVATLTQHIPVIALISHSDTALQPLQRWESNAPFSGAATERLVFPCCMSLSCSGLWSVLRLPFFFLFNRGRLGSPRREAESCVVLCDILCLSSYQHPIGVCDDTSGGEADSVILFFPAGSSLDVQTSISLSVSSHPLSSVCTSGQTWPTPPSVFRHQQPDPGVQLLAQRPVNSLHSQRVCAVKQELKSKGFRGYFCGASLEHRGHVFTLTTTVSSYSRGCGRARDAGLTLMSPSCRSKADKRCPSLCVCATSLLLLILVWSSLSMISRAQLLLKSALMSILCSTRQFI